MALDVDAFVSDEHPAEVLEQREQALTLFVWHDVLVVRNYEQQRMVAVSLVSPHGAALSVVLKHLAWAPAVTANLAVLSVKPHAAHVRWRDDQHGVYLARGVQLAGS